MSSIKSFVQSVQKAFQPPSKSTKNVAVDVHHEIIQKPFEGPIDSIKKVAVDVRHEIIQKPFQGPIDPIKNVAVDVHHEIIQKPSQGPINLIKNVAVAPPHFDQQHLNDLLTQPRRLEAKISVEAAQKVVDNAYHDGMVEGALMGSGLASQVSGFAWGAMVKRAAFAAARSAVAEAEAGVIPATFYGAGADLQFGGAAALATGAATGAGAAEAGAVTLAATSAAPFILPAFLFGAGVILTSVAMGYGITHGSHSVHGV